MLNLAKTRIEASRHYDVASAYSINQEGLALIFANDNGIGKVRPSAGAAGTEVFAGVSLSHTMVPTSAVYFGTITAVGTALTLPNAPVSGQIVLADGAQALTLGSASNANEYSVSGNTATLHSGQSGKDITVRYRYTLTVEQALLLYGEGMLGELASADIYDRVGAITRGQVATDQYDITAAFVAGAAVKIGANGQFAMTGSGPTVANAIVRETPAAGNGGWLVLDLL